MPGLLTGLPDLLGLKTQVEAIKSETEAPSTALKLVLPWLFIGGLLILIFRPPIFWKKK